MNKFKIIAFIMVKIVRNSAYMRSIKRGNFRKAAEDAFLGPIYTKLCLDAGVFKLGYFVVENN